MLLQLLPRSGGFGELLGKFVAPFSLAGIAFSLLAALVVNETGNYRTIWLFPAAAGVLQAIIMCWLWVPESQAHVKNQGIGNRFIDSVYNQIMDGNRRLFGGEVTSEDADGASLFASARNLLGNPYGLVADLEGIEGFGALAARVTGDHPDHGEPGHAEPDPSGQDSGVLPVPETDDRAPLAVDGLPAGESPGTASSHEDP
jgi:hypothetical protein